MTDGWLFLLALGIGLASALAYLWVARSIGRWLATPSQKPRREDYPPTETGQALYDLAVAWDELHTTLNDAIRPPVERLVRWLARRA